MSDEGRELFLYATNDGDLYRQSHIPAIKTLCRKIAAGTYDRDKAIVLFGHMAEEAAKKYSVEFGSPDHKWRVMFPPAARTECATMLRDAFEAEYRANGYDGINPIAPEKRRPLP